MKLNTIEPNGLGGWLACIGIGLIISQIYLLNNLTDSLSFFSTVEWDTLTTPGTESYNPLFVPLAIFEFSTNLGFIVLGFWVLTLFARESANFPKLYIWYMVVSLIIYVSDIWFVSFVLPSMKTFNPTTTAELSMNLIKIGIWVPYILLSKRVRNTFVN